MGSRAAVVVERKTSRARHIAVQQAVGYLQAFGYETAQFASIEASGRVAADLRADIVLLSTGSGKASLLVAELKQLRQAFPHAHLLVTTDSFNSISVSKAYGAGAAVVAPPGGFADAVRNMICVTGDLVTVTDSAQVRAAATASSHPIEKEVVQEFHDPETGRLDAMRVAKAYGISLSALAKALGVTQSALSKRTTAPAAQRALRELEFAWAVLLDAIESPERVRAWLNAKRIDLGGKPPIMLLLEGPAEAFANYIRSVVAGEPG
jgi:DNA-binding NarL/FixJ family response regulator